MQATFAPLISAEGSLEYGIKRWKFDLRGIYVGERHQRLSLSSTDLPAYFDLRAGAEFALLDDLSLLAEGRNLLSQAVQEFGGYPEPAPYLGLGVFYRF